MTKAAILIGAMLLFAGVAAAGTLTGHGRSDGPTIETPTGTVQHAEDISGPCDEAEHANDPRCTGAAGVQRRDDDADRDHHNSGPGNAEHNSGHEDDGNSGPGGGDDD